MESEIEEESMMMEEELEGSIMSNKYLEYLDYDDEEVAEGYFPINSRRPNAHGGLHHCPNNSTLQPLSNRYQNFSSRIRVGPLEEWEGRSNIGMSNSVTTSIREFVRDMAIGRTKATDRADRATVEKVLDFRTSLIIAKLKGRHVYEDLNGCISTGKEAVPEVSHLGWGHWYTLRELEVATEGFSDENVIGEGGYGIVYCGVLEDNTRVAAGWAAPILNDAALSLDKLREGYREGHMHIIDVSQAVEPSQPNAIEFLRQDCVHVSDFFKKRGVAVMTTRELFDFIVDPSIGEEAVDSYLDEIQQKIVARGDISGEDEIAESVFVQSYIPSTLNQVMNVEADVVRLTSGEDTEDMYYKTITGLSKALSSVPPSPPETEFDSSGSDEENSIVSDSSSTIEEAQEEPIDKKVARKENKKKVKEEKREARKHKLRKAVKKKRKKLSKGGKRR
ncbi:hypothetical protein LguiA_017386 [Lonicera macranthoides]